MMAWPKNRELQYVSDKPFGYAGKMQQLLDNNQCPRCRCSLPPVEVHGHVQCSSCKLYINECCTGEQGEMC
jgi:hypothetical protein